MKSSIFKYRWFTAGILATALAACGGYTTVNLGGSVTGLVYDGLVLVNDGMTVSVPKGAASYTFPNQIGDSAKYAVTVQAQPPHLDCRISSGSGTATGIAITTANVFCSVNTYTVGGTITGLKASGLQLTNGGDNLVVDASATSFTFVGRVADGSSYGVAVLAQPTGQVCTPNNGTATMGAANVTNITIDCK